MNTRLHSHVNRIEPTRLSDDLSRFIEVEVSSQRDVEVTLDTDLVMSGLVDSLGVVMIVEWLEQRLHVTIDPADVVIEHFASVDAIIEYLHFRDDVPLSSGS